MIKKFSNSMFLRNDSGVAAVELALLLPLFMTLLLGAVAVYDLLKAQNLAINAAGTAAELIARDDVVTNTDINNAFEAAKAMLGPHGGKLKIRISNVEFIDGKINVAWGKAKGVAEFTNASINQVSLPPLEEYGSAIVAEVLFDYKLIFQLPGINSGTVRSSAVRRPVFVEFINHNF